LRPVALAAAVAPSPPIHANSPRRSMVHPEVKRPVCPSAIAVASAAPLRRLQSLLGFSGCIDAVQGLRSARVTGDEGHP
jgi:hypothetical protein